MEWNDIDFWLFKSIVVMMYISAFMVEAWLLVNLGTFMLENFVGNMSAIPFAFLLVVPTILMLIILIIILFRITKKGVDEFVNLLIKLNILPEELQI